MSFCFLIAIHTQNAKQKARTFQKIFYLQCSTTLIAQSLHQRKNTYSVIVDLLKKSCILHLLNHQLRKTPRGFAHFVSKELWKNPYRILLDKCFLMRAPLINSSALRTWDSLLHQWLRATNRKMKRIVIIAVSYSSVTAWQVLLQIDMPSLRATLINTLVNLLVAARRVSHRLLRSYRATNLGASLRGLT